LFPNAKRFADYREMLDTMKDIDAVTISTPDHVHGPAAKYAMERGKHVYVQKKRDYLPKWLEPIKLSAKWVIKELLIHF
jgi:hypothetical protein